MGFAIASLCCVAFAVFAFGAVLACDEGIQEDLRPGAPFRPLTLYIFFLIYLAGFLCLALALFAFMTWPKIA